MYEFSILDFLFAPIYIVILLSIARNIQQSNIEKRPEYKYFVQGFIVKIFGGIGLCLIYIFYYKGGDTLNYIEDTRLLLRVAYTDFGAFSEIMVNGISRKAYGVFNYTIGYPNYNFYKIEEWKLIRFTTPFALLGLRLFIPTTLVLAWFSYQGIWRLYLVFVDRFPKIYKELAIPLLFIPSCAFWGSGILKDTFTYSAVGWFVFSFLNIFIKKKDIKTNIFSLLMSSWLIISIKPYIFIALLPGALIWLNFERLKSIKSAFIRVLALPVIMGVLGIGGVFILTQFGGAFGKYSSIDKALETAVVTQQDLKRSEYQGASFDIGNFEPTIPGIISKMPAAITAGLFRPFIWEARNPVMLISGVENLIFMGLTIRLFFTLGLLGFFKQIGSNPLLMFSLVFSLFFAFSVGLTTSNFGSLVRYKIPCEPFYLGTLYAMMYSKKSGLLEAEEAEEIKRLEAKEKEKEKEDAQDDVFRRQRSKTGFIVK